MLFLRFLTSFGMTLLTLFYDWKRFGATSSRRIFSSNVYIKNIFIPNTVRNILALKISIFLTQIS
ncbi:hypothetical protein J4771_11915 [Candidatus Kaistella beijingensis]|uniref:hypothetical protein n=1 Tax=Candidatus Kaistella beijingensis TaxID=2820270 RepID=UPI001CC71D3B|nr:hypothetical protein [Candidatus Kaistella beijingensis]UBB89547.1 hypothetical protein J4771_11915 [Candidatus Kaistella beijingensis]